MKTVFRRKNNGDDEPYIIHIDSQLFLQVSGYPGDFTVKKIFKNGSVSLRSKFGRYVKFEPNSDGRLILPII